jgi:threo-3-hydroxy-L-aspartate ammonia-lyase
VVDLVSLDDVRAAARRLDGVVVRTPLIPFPASVSRPQRPQQPAGSPASVLIKPESLQPTGSFKLRGAYNAIAALDDAAQGRGVVAHSSGNHGFAVAYAAGLLGVKAAIVVPHNAPKIKTDAIRAAGAELVLVEPTLAARMEGAMNIARDRGYALIPPYDNRQVIAGQGTIGLEIAEDCRSKPPTAVLVPISGGGLISGIAVAIRALIPQAKIIGVEPELAADTRESFRGGSRVAWPPADVARTAADALRVEQVGELTFAHIRELVHDIVTVTEDEMFSAIRMLALRAHLVAEPGGAAAVAASLFRDPAELGGGAGPLVAILSGGNIDPSLLARVLAPDIQSYTG